MHACKPTTRAWHYRPSIVSDNLLTIHSFTEERGTCNWNILCLCVSKKATRMSLFFILYGWSRFMCIFPELTEISTLWCKHIRLRVKDPKGNLSLGFGYCTICHVAYKSAVDSSTYYRARIELPRDSRATEQRMGVYYYGITLQLQKDSKEPVVRLLYCFII